MLYGVTDAQVNSSTWLAADDDGDGISNGAELAAGTNPFQPNSRLQVATVTSNSTTVSLSFPSINQKLYTAQSTASLNPLNWQPVAGVSVVGDGTSKTLVCPKTAGAFFRVVVQDQSTSGDQVGDWAKAVLGYATGTSISSQSIYDHTALANALATQNVVTVSATDPTAIQPPDSVTAPSDAGIITFTRSGYQSFSSIIVPIQKSGTAIEGTDYAALPNSVTFPPWVNSVTLNVTPLYNPTRTNSTTLTVAAQAGGGYSLGASTSASVAIYPGTVAGTANGTGLSGQYYAGSSASYTNATALGVATGSYTFTPVTSTTGTITVTYTGAPAIPFAVGSPVTLTFTNGPLFLSANDYYNGTYNITSVGANNFTVTTTVNGVTLAGSGNGNVTINPFAAPTNASNFGGLGVTYTYSKLTTTTGTAVISYTGTPATAFTVNGAVAVQFTGGNLFTGAAVGVYDKTYTIAAVTGGSGSGTLTLNITGTAVPGSQTGSASATITPFTAPAITRLDPTVDFLWGSGQPTNASLQTATNNNWSARWDGNLSGKISTVTMTIASPCVVAWTNHGLKAGAPVIFSTTGALPTGLTAGAIYYVSSTGLTTNAFEVSAAVGGTPVNTSGTQSGTQTATAVLTQTSTVTMTIASPCVVTWANHGFQAGASVVFSSTGALPTGLTAGTAYFVSSTGLAPNTFEISATPGGTPINTSGTQSGTQTALAYGNSTYTFQLQANDGARLYVNNTLVIDAWTPGASSYAPYPVGGATISLNPLTTPVIPIRVEYYHLDGTTASFNLGWKPPGGSSFVNIPSSNVFLSNGTATNGWSGSYWTNIGGDAPSPGNSTVNISIASPAVVTWNSHALIPGTPVVFTSSAANGLPTGLTAGSTYYVLSAGLTANNFEVSATPGGAAVNTSGTQSGTQTAFSFTAFYGVPRYGDYPSSLANLSWPSQPSATLPSTNNYSVRWDGYLSPTETSTVTMTIASPTVVTWTNHGLQAGAPVVFSTTGALPTGLTAGTTYYVIAAGLAANTFEVSAAPNGSAVNTSGTQSGTHTAVAGGTDTYTFDVLAADGARVYLDLNQNGTFDTGETIIDAWTGQAASSPLTSGSYTLTAGQLYRLRVEYNDTSSSAAVVNVRMKSNSTGTMAPIPAGCVFRADPLSGAPTTTKGLWAGYYSNAALTDPPLYAAQDTSTSTLTNSYGASKPATGSLGSAGSNNYAGRFDTYIKTTSQVGTYGFQLVAATAGRLVFNNTEVIPFTAGTSTTTVAGLSALTTYPVRVEFYDVNASGSVVLSWKPGNTGSFATVPAANFFQDAGATTPGVVGNYWTNTAFLGVPSFSDFQTQINYSKGTGQPGDSWAAANFSASWDGYLAAATANTYTFSLQAQSQARLYVNGTLVIDGWTTPGSAATPLTGTISLPGGTNARVPIHVDYASSTTGGFLYVLWQPPTQASLTTIPNSAIFRDATTSQQGLLATYYANTTQTPPFFYQVQENNNPELNYFYGTGRPDPSLPFDAFTVRWTGQVLPQYTEPYYFTVKSDDGARLWVNGQLVINQWKTQGTTENVSPPISLQAGVFYDIKLEYLESTGNAECHLNWYSGDQAEQIIPTARLFPTMTGQAGAGATGVTSNTSDVYVAGSGSPYSYNISGSNGPGTYSASNLPTGLSLSGNVISGTLSNPGNYQFTVTTNNASGTSSEVVNLQVVGAPGNITREIWTGLAGPSVSDIPLLSTPPNNTDNTLTTIEDTSAYGNNTGERLRGYFTAPATGNYYFWIAGSGGAVDANHTAAELWISDSDQAVARIRRGYVAGTTGTGSRVWNAQATQQSPWLSLVGGQRYYFEVLHNTGSSGSSSNVSVGWFFDPTGNTANPIANGANPAAAATGGVVPNFVLWPWDNPPTLATSGPIYLASLAGPTTLSGIKATGGAYIRVNGSTGIVHVDYSGLTSGATTQQLYAAPVGSNPPTLLFDLGAQDKNYSTLKTSDGGYTWSMQGSDLTALQTGKVFLAIGTTNNPITANNPYGELTGTFGAVAGSQIAPSLPSYTSPSWADDHATNDASNSRFLTQATFGPSPSDMGFVSGTLSSSVKNLGYRPWMENQFTLSGTHNVPYILAHLTGDPQNPYNDALFFNSWWNNSVKAPDQLRQRVAFALSEILVTSDVGPLNNNGRTLGDYYDTLVDYAFTDFRTILKQVTLTSAMGVYLNMQGNYKGSYQTGLHPNENYAREIMQLFSIGLYRLWPDGTLVLDSTGNPIPTYDQTVITGMARVFTGWNWGQSLVSGRLPTSTPGSNYLDPMVLISTQHELGTKILLDNVMLPAAIVTTQADTSHDPNPNPITIQSTDPANGPGNVVSTSITSSFDLNGLHDLEAALNSIMNSGSVGPFICRQLIQRLVTSNPKPEYVYRVVRAFNGERNIDGVATGVVGDMKDVIRAILLDPEARSATEATAIGFGKQREPLLRMTAAARAFPVTGIANATYRQQGGQIMLVTTPTAHRLSTNDFVLLDNWVDGGTPSSTTNLPYTQPYSVGNVTSNYTYVGSTHIATIPVPGYKAGDVVNIQFTSGMAAPFNTVQSYTVASAAPDTGLSGSFTVNLGSGGPSSSTSGSAFTPNNFTVNTSGVATSTYSIGGTGNQTVTVNSGGLTAGHQLYIKFTSGSLLNAGYDGIYTVQNGTGGNTITNFTVTLSSSPPGTTSGGTLIPKLSGGYTVTTAGNQSTITLQTANNFDVKVGDQIQVDFLVTLTPLGAASQVYTVTGVPAGNLITIASPTVITAGTESTTGMVAYPLNNNAMTRSGAVNVDYGTFNIGNTTTGNALNQSPLNSATVFNFFYPNYQYPGAIAAAGMTTPEFQLTDDSDTMNLTNTVTNSILNSGTGNAFGFSVYGSGLIFMDLGQYMTQAQTQDSAIQALATQLATLLDINTNNLPANWLTTISSYVGNTTNFPYSSPPTTTQMRDRVRATLQLLLTSAEFAIQK